LSKAEKHTDLSGDKPEIKPINRPIYEDKGPPGEDQMDNLPDLKPPSPPKIDISNKPHFEKPSDTTFGNTTPLFDEPPETSSSISAERKEEESSNLATVGDEQ
jgi:hypothetical protein